VLAHRPLNYARFFRGTDNRSEKGIFKKPAVGPQQSYGLASQVGKSGFEELQNVVRTGYIPGTKPKVGNKLKLSDKRQKRMMACPSVPVRIVAATGTLLLPVTGYHRRIKIKGNKLHLRKFAKQSTIHVPLYTLIRKHVKTPKKTHDRLELGSA